MKIDLTRARASALNALEEKIRTLGAGEAQHRALADAIALEAAGLSELADLGREEAGLPPLSEVPVLIYDTEKGTAETVPVPDPAP